MKKPFPILCRLLVLTFAALSISTPLSGQDGGGDAEAPAPEAVTIADPSIPVEQLKKLLRAPTEEELAIEATGWQGLVQAKVAEIAQTEIASLEKKEDVADAADTAAEVAADEAPESATQQAEKEVEAKAVEKEQINEAIAQLNEDKAALLERFGLVLDAWEEKGGDVSKMRTYSSAVSGIEVEVKDAGATAAAIKGWLTSKEGGVKWLKNILQFLAIMLVAWMIAGIVGALVKKATALNKDMSDLLRRFLNKIVRRLVLLVGFIVALSTLGVNVGAIMALVGGGAFIIGFALQDTLGNFAAGLMLLMYRPFDEGDVVNIGGVTGKVDHVSLVSTKIRTADNQVILVPNKNVWGQTITNVTGSTERRVDLVFGVGYDDDLAKAQSILENLVAAHEKVLKDPAPVVRVNELGPSSVDFVCRPWAKTADYWEVYWDITRQVKDAFDAEKISIPFPQTQIHVSQAPKLAEGS